MNSETKLLSRLFKALPEKLRACARTDKAALEEFKGGSAVAVVGLAI